MFKVVMIDGTTNDFSGNCTHVDDLIQGFMEFSYRPIAGSDTGVCLGIINKAYIKKIINTDAEKMIEEFDKKWREGEIK